MEYQGERIWRILDQAGLSLSFSQLPTHLPSALATHTVLTFLPAEFCSSEVGFGLGWLEPAGFGFQHPLIDWVCSIRNVGEAASSQGQNLEWLVCLTE